MKLFIDTWGWLALGDRRDPSHQRVKKFLRAFDSRGGLAYTTDYVLDETITRLFMLVPFPIAKGYVERTIWEAVATGHLRLERITPERFAKAWGLRKRYHDKPEISFTDLTSFIIMEELRIREALTADAHFEHVGLGFTRVP